MDKIIERKSRAISSIVNKIKLLEIENRDLINKVLPNDIGVKISILSKVADIDVNRELDKLIEKYVLSGSSKMEIIDLINLCETYHKESNFKNFNKIAKEIINGYLDQNITLEEAEKLTDMFDNILYKNSLIFEVIGRIIDNGIIDYFKLYLMNNRETLTEFTLDTVEITTIIKRIVDVLIINKELSLQLGHDEIFKVLNKYLELIDINVLDIKTYVDIVLLNIVYSKENISIISYKISEDEYTDEIELLKYIYAGIEDSYFDVDMIGNLSNYRQQYLIDKIINSVHMKEKELADINNKVTSLENNNTTLEKKKMRTVEIVEILNGKENQCNCCLDTLIKEKVWLAYYTDKDQKKYNGVIEAVLNYCKICNKYFTDKRHIESIEKELKWEVIKLRN